MAVWKRDFREPISVELDKDLEQLCTKGFHPRKPALTLTQEVREDVPVESGAQQWVMPIVLWELCRPRSPERLPGGHPGQDLKQGMALSTLLHGLVAFWCCFSVATAWVCFPTSLSQVVGTLVILLVRKLRSFKVMRLSKVTVDGQW